MEAGVHLILMHKIRTKNTENLQAVEAAAEEGLGQIKFILLKVCILLKPSSSRCLRAVFA